MGVVAAIASQAKAEPLSPRGSLRTAQDPDSWLVLYNENSPQSQVWVNWYATQRSIPAGNLVGLNASTSEHLATVDEVQAQIVGPVRTLLDSDEELRGRIMGIILGFGLPGNYFSAPAGGPGGYSVADALQDMYDDELPPAEQKEYNLLCPHFQNSLLPPNGRLTKESLPPNTYIVARIDAPSVSMAYVMTARALAIESDDHHIHTERGYYDYSDSIFSSGTWLWLKTAVETPSLAVPWRAFESDTEGTSFDAFRIDAHDVDGWNDGRLYSDNPGSRIFAFNFNSWGATTVRSTTDQGGRFVPNALVSGYAAAIGATGEPQFGGPFPAILLAGLQQGWTLGESFFLSNPLNDWMWTLVGDPLLRVPHWFDDYDMGNGDINRDYAIDGQDVALLTGILTGTITDPLMIAAADMSGDNIVNDDDAYLILGPSLYGTPTPEVYRGSCDLNLDNRTNSVDLDLFVKIIADNGATQWPLRWIVASDVNLDGVVTMADVPGFIDKITSISPDELSLPIPDPPDDEPPDDDPPDDDPPPDPEP